MQARTGKRPGERFVGAFHHGQQHGKRHRVWETGATGALAWGEDRLAAGVSLSEVRSGLARSAEAELARARAGLAGGGSLQGVLSGLLRSDGASASAWRTRALYKAELGRGADTGSLRAGRTHSRPSAL